MKHILITLVITLAFLITHAQQNLVLNPSFEQISRCPPNNDYISLAYFWNGLDSTINPDSNGIAGPIYRDLPDLHDTCAPRVAHCPTNDFYYQWPRTGHAMAQMLTYYNWFAFPHSVTDTVYIQHYLQGRLKVALTGGLDYCVTFYLNMVGASNVAINKFGAYFDDGSIDTVRTKYAPLPQYIPQVLDSFVISDTLNWVKVQGRFTATGTERFITLGVFADTATLTKVIFNPAAVYAGYLLDDVSVVESNANAFAGTDTSIRAGDTITRGQTTGGEGMPCYWYSLGGTTAIDSGGTLHAHPASTTTYVIKMDLCGRVTYDTVTVHVWPLGFANSTIRQFDNLAMSPNPIVNEMIISGAGGTDVSVMDLAGRVIMGFHAGTDKKVVDVSGLLPGVYVVSVVDPISGERVVKKVVKG